MGPSFCPPRTKPSNFPTPAALPAAGGGGGGAEKGVSGQKPAPRQNARNATILPSACVYGVTKRGSHLTRTFPCILAVSIRLFSFILPPLSSRSATERFELGEFGTAAVCSANPPLRSQPASQPASPPGSESARKWVGLQPSVDY